MKIQFSFLLLVTFLVIPVHSLPIRTEPLPELKDFSGVDDLDPAQLFDLSLILSGAASSEIITWQENREVILKKIKEGLKSVSKEKYGEELLLWLHKEKILNRYVISQTRVHKLLKTGEFNCVSSALIYMSFARSLGLRVNAVETQDHAFCIVETPEGLIDVETTQALGWNPGAKHEFKDQFGKLTGFTYVPPGNYSGRKTVNDRRLLGLLIQNIMAENLKNLRPWDNIGLAYDRVSIEGKTALNEIDKAYNNYAAYLNQRREYTLGMELVEAIRIRDPGSPVLNNLALTFFNNDLAQYLNNKDFTRARIQFAVWEKSKLISAQDLKSMNHELEFAHLGSLAQSLDWAEFQLQLTSVQMSKILSDEEVKRLTDSVITNEAVRIYRLQGTRASWVYLKSLTDGQRNLPGVKRVWDTTVRNLEIDFHNRFAQFANQKNWTEASRILEEGLGVLPGSELLKKDRLLIK